MTIEMLSVVTPAQRPLRAIFESSFRDTFPLRIVEIEDDGQGNGDFQSSSWRSAILRKQEMVHTAIVRNLGRILIVSDIDIQFFKPTLPTIETMLSNDLDMVFQAEYLHDCNRTLNAGFIIMKCSERVEALYEQLLNANLSALPLPDQSWFNQNIRSFPIRWDLLPSSFYAWSHHPNNPPRDIVLHHANCTTGPNSLKQKLDQLEYVRLLVANQIK